MDAKAFPAMTLTEHSNEAGSVSTPISNEDYISQGARPKTSEVTPLTASLDTPQQDVLVDQMHPATYQSLSAKNNLQHHGRNSEPHTSSAVLSDSACPSTSSQPGMKLIPFPNTDIKEVSMGQGSSMSGYPSVQYNVYNSYNVPQFCPGNQISDHNQSPELYETRTFPQLLLKPLQRLDLEDWKMLASHLELDKFIESIESNVKNHGKSPTKLLLDKLWQSRGTKADINEIKNALQKMERIDVLDDFTDALEEWENHN